MPLWTYLLAGPILLGLILLHELGHYLVARHAGIAVAEFAIGFGPRLVQYRALGTCWTLRLIPLGGFVRFEEDGPDSFELAPLATRARVIAGGPLANLLVTVLLLGGMATVLGHPWWQAPWLGVKWTALLTERWFTVGAELLSGGGTASLNGPVTIVAHAAGAVAAGGPDLLLTAALLSLNLCFLNLLPIPPLDGSKLILLGLEWVRRRRLHPDTEGWFNAGGMLTLLTLAVLVVGRDLLGILSGLL